MSFIQNAFYEFFNINALIYVMLAIVVAGTAGILRLLVYRESAEVLIREYIECNLIYEFSIEDIPFNCDKKIKNIIEKLVKEKVIHKKKSENRYFFGRRDIIIL